MDLHRRIRTLRIRRGLTGTELARRSGVSPSYVSLIEHGEKTPSEDVAVRLARALGDREDVYRVWAATSRMEQATQDAVWRLRGADRELRRLSDAADARHPPDEACPDDEFSMSPGVSRAIAERARPSGRPRIRDRYEFQVSHELDDDARAPTLRVPLLAPGAAPTTDPPPAHEVEALVAIDARILDRASASGLVALRVDELNGQDVSTWLKARDLVIVERRPDSFDPGLIHVFRRPEGLRLARASLAPGLLLLLPDPSRTTPPRALPLDGDDPFEKILYGTVVFSGRLWPAAGR